MNKKEFILKAVSSLNLPLDIAIKLINEQDYQGLGADTIIASIISRSDCPLATVLELADRGMKLLLQFLSALTGRISLLINFAKFLKVEV